MPDGKSHEDLLHAQVAQRVDRLRMSLVGLAANALRAVRVLKTCEHPHRPDVDSGLLNEREGPQSRMLANNDRGVIKDVERLQGMSILVVGLNGMGCMIAETYCRSGIGTIFLCDNSNVFKADLGRMFFRPDSVGYTRMGEVESMLHAINHDVHVEQLHVDFFDAAWCRRLNVVLRPAQRPTRPSTSPFAEGLFTTTPPPLVVFLCVDEVHVTKCLNEWALETNVPLVHAKMGPDGLSGTVVTSIRGKMRCLLCYQPATPSSSQSSQRSLRSDSISTPSSSAQLHKKALPILPASSPCLPMFESIVASIAAHNALKHMLGFGTVSPFLQYCGLQEAIEHGAMPPSPRLATPPPPSGGHADDHAAAGMCASPLCRAHNSVLFMSKPRKRKDSC
ncbi:hypothetical protein H310_13708 [Aphanomyces invadans]|uniref:Ubiquitin-like modifier-activating enzyme 5 n=1 Tax=Aphanomyces invadans TaxID=157072 RepID=A0A024TCR9_9STRA|nr:hypothetical protein H310_13708 [Aphanomyces invadans]ETV91920.1 hypothetical protein H310_13708 [Aphanomyces invadans]|eukprot:XP_008879557.1 hypothetical protein H310_13708 [Aphanomyces invadans]